MKKPGGALGNATRYTNLSHNRKLSLRPAHKLAIHSRATARACDTARIKQREGKRRRRVAVPALVAGRHKPNAVRALFQSQVAQVGHQVRIVVKLDNAFREGPENSRSHVFEIGAGEVNDVRRNALRVQALDKLDALPRIDRNSVQPENGM